MTDWLNESPNSFAAASHSSLVVILNPFDPQPVPLVTSMYPKSMDEWFGYNLDPIQDPLKMSHPTQTQIGLHSPESPQKGGLNSKLTYSSCNSSGSGDGGGRSGSYG